MGIGDWGLVASLPVTSHRYWGWIEMAIERDIYGHPKRPKWEKFILLLIAAGVAFVVAGGYDLFVWFVEMCKNRGQMP